MIRSALWALSANIWMGCWRWPLPAEGQHLFVLFLGSTIGNFDRAAGVKFLTEVRRILEPGDSLLLGTDLEKPSATVAASLRR